MSRASKLFEELLRSGKAGVRFSDFEYLLGAFGFRHDRTKGSHRIYIHRAVPRPFPIQPDGKDAKRYQVREFLDMIEEYGLSIEE